MKKVRVLVEHELWTSGHEVELKKPFGFAQGSRWSTAKASPNLQKVPETIPRLF